MRVHIVCRDLSTEKILPRLGRSLARGAGWSLSDTADKSADANYWMIYIDMAERNSDWRATPSLAYFSHYERQTAFKRLWWETASGIASGAVLTARQYENDLPDALPKFLVRPPIDAMFEYDASMTLDAKRQRVGFSGFVDRSGRKGAELATRLQTSFPGIDFVACGRGWPVSTTLLPMQSLPSFYQSLRVLVCTANVEGIPMPPLEALACGTPIVIPYGVGLLDDLPSVPGIHRYHIGDYDELREKVAEALNGSPYSPEELSTLARETYNDEHWCADNVVAAESILSRRAVTVSSSSLPLTLESDRHGQCGVLYVAYGEPARRCAIGAIESFRQFVPNVPIALVSNKPLGIEDTFIMHADEDIGGRSAKTKIYELAPRSWQYILYLDADTEIIADISFLFQVLIDGWDMVICKNPGKYHTARYMKRSDNEDECQHTFNTIGTDQVLQLNGGVFAFQRNSRTETFFTQWHSEWRNWGKRDQAALLRSLFANPLKLYVLTNVWNTITRYESADTSAGILHYPMMARRWRGVIHSRSDEPNAWKAVEAFERENAK